MRMRFSFLAATLLTTWMVSAPAPAGAQDLTRGDVEVIIREYLLTNPQVLEEAFTELQRIREAEANAQRMAALSEVRDELVSFAQDPVMGNPDGSVTLVEFFDYNCGFCVRAFDDVVRLIEANPDLRVVMKEFPVLGQGSTEAATVSLAVNMIAPEKYAEFHELLLNYEGAKDGTVALAIAGELGIPVDEIEAMQRSPEVEAVVTESYQVAEALGLSGTPSFVVGDTVEPGAVGYERLQAAVNRAVCGEDTC